MGRNSNNSKSGYSGFSASAPNINKPTTPKSQSLKGQVKNEAGGFIWKIDRWTQFDRFLILGSLDGNYYTKSEDLTKMNLAVVKQCVEEDGQRALNRIIEIRTQDRAKKFDQLLIAFAYVMAYADAETKKLANRSIPLVAKTLRHQLKLARFVNEYAGWSRGRRDGFGHIFREMEVSDLAYQVAKYSSDNGWTLNDLLRLTHTVEHGTINPVSRKIVLQYVKKGWPSVGETPHEDPNVVQIWAKERLKALEAPVLKGKQMAKVLSLITGYRLTHEMVPNSMYKYPEVWAAMLPHMPTTAVLRNLGRLTSNGVLVDRANLALVLKKLSIESLERGRIHPMQAYIAHRVYITGSTPQRPGKSDSESMRWSPIAAVSEKLEDAFFGLLKHETPTNKIYEIGLDVSGSMQGTMVQGTPNVSACEASAAIALAFVQIEPTENVDMVAYDTVIKPISANKKTALNAFAELIKQKAHGGGTDCSQPILNAMQLKKYVDIFVVITDSQDWGGKWHPAEAMKAYRETPGCNPNAKLVVVAVAANSSTIGDPKDRGVLNVVGFDANVLRIIQEFAVEG